jgi:hypothetical protein
MTVNVQDWSHYQTKPGYHRWRHRRHIAPFIDSDGRDRLFYDLGANAGYHMRQAAALGYRVKGIDIDPRSVALSPDLDIEQGDVNYLEPLPAHTTLLSCVHYHQTTEQANALFHALSYSTVYLIVMGRHKGEPKSNPTKQHLIRRHLYGYDPVDERDSRFFYSVLLKNRRCNEFEVDDLYQATREFTATLAAGEYDDWVPTFEEFVRRSLDDMDYDATGSAWMDYLRRRKLSHKIGRCWMYKRLIQDIQKHGLRAALKVSGNRISDGMHRLIIWKELGGTRVVCRR